MSTRCSPSAKGPPCGLASFAETEMRSTTNMMTTPGAEELIATQEGGGREFAIFARSDGGVTKTEDPSVSTCGKGKSGVSCLNPEVVAVLLKNPQEKT